MPICWIWGVGEAGEETGVDSLHGHAADEAQCGTETSDALASGGGTPGLKLKTAAGTVSLPFLSECDGACWPPPCNRSASFNPEASAIWIRGTAGAVGIPGENGETKLVHLVYLVCGEESETSGTGERCVKRET